jgi:hypothetical protein
MAAIMNAVEMPDRVAGDLILFIRQNDGLPKKEKAKMKTAPKAA